MFGDSFFTVRRYSAIHLWRPWVFVPMFGDSFFTGIKSVAYELGFNMEFSSPCLGILFSRVSDESRKHHDGVNVFVPMFGDSFFTIKCNQLITLTSQRSFRPHVWGFFFHRSRPGMPHGVGFLWPFCGGDFQLIGILIIFTL